jgi:peroxiredoxin Q/BCP
MTKSIALPAGKVALDDGTYTDVSVRQGRWLVLYAYPKDSTPGCTQEANEFRDVHDKFLALDTDVFGLSRDSVASHARFRSKQALPFPLISDPEEVLCQHLDLIQEKVLYGKRYLGLVRSTFLFDPTGICRAVWSPVKVKGHAQHVLEKLQQLRHSNA